MFFKNKTTSAKIQAGKKWISMLEFWQIYFIQEEHE